MLVQKKIRQPDVIPLQLRRTSSALATKFARRFKSNSPIKIQTLRVPPLHVSKPKHEPINAKQERMLLENSLYTSIYTQTGQKQASNRSQSNSSGDKSASPPLGDVTSGGFEQARPSYAEPTRKDLQPRKELNRPKIAKALE